MDGGLQLVCGVAGEHAAERDADERDECEK
jgi:hypothetical protein